MIIFSATSRRAVCLTDDPLTAGSVGVETRFQLAGWDNVSARVAIFAAGQVKVDVVLNGSSCMVPPEVLASAGEKLVIGLYGTGPEGELVIPTIYAEAGRILPGAAPSGIEPTPQTQPLIDQLLAAAQAARNAADEAERLAQSVRDDADSGAFDGEDGADGSGVWYTTERISGVENPYVRRRDLVGREGATVQVHDLLFAPDIGDEGAPTTLYEITSVGIACLLNRLCKMQGSPGEPGEDGTPGQDGQDGTTFTPSVSEDGVISWTNDGGKQNPESVDLVAAVLDALPTWDGGSY